MPVLYPAIRASHKCNDVLRFISVFRVRGSKRYDINLAMALAGDQRLKVPRFFASETHARQVYPNIPPIPFSAVLYPVDPASTKP